MRPPLRAAASWLAGALATIAALALVGWLPTARLGGEPAVAALLAGCAVGFAGSALGALPVVLALASGGAAKPHATAAWAMALRAGGTLVGALVLTLGTGLPRTALLAWVGLAYGALLVVETRWTVRWLGSGGR
jgi:hypothetical protein